jgi:hypothetical protein
MTDPAEGWPKPDAAISSKSGDGVGIPFFMVMKW